MCSRCGWSLIDICLVLETSAVTTCPNHFTRSSSKTSTDTKSVGKYYWQCRAALSSHVASTALVFRMAAFPLGPTMGA